jgi:hypothetical protein
MQNIPCGLTPAELPAREQLHEQNNDFTTMIQYFFESPAEKIKKNFHALGSSLVLHRADAGRS